MLLASLVLGSGSPAHAVSPRNGGDTIELIVKFEPGIAGSIAPGDALAAVREATSAPHPSHFALYTLLGRPVAARWLIASRLSASALQSLRLVDPQHPQIQLMQYVVLTYANSGDRQAAEVRLRRETLVHSLRANTNDSFSLRPDDYFANTDPASNAPQGYQWPLEAVYAMGPYGSPGSASAWDIALGSGYVGVVDSGVDVAHPDLQANLRLHFSQAFYSNLCSGVLTDVDERGASSNCPNTYVGHGTLVAGLVGATTNNSIGVAGICWHCSLIVAKSYSNNVGPVSDVINGVYHATIRGAQVINRSGGDQDYLQTYGVGVNACSQLSTGTDAYCDALDLAARRDIVVVAAAGNQNNVKAGATSVYATTFPATEPSVVSAGGTVLGDEIWRDDALPGVAPLQGSNLDKLEFVAPAKQVISTFYRGGTWFYPTWCSDAVNDSTYPGGYGYDECTGTSFAAPLVTGVVAAARSINPLTTRSQLVSLVTTTSRVVAGSYRMPDMHALLQQVAAGNGSVTPMFAFVSGTDAGAAGNRFYTAAVQMGVAAIYGTMLPLPDSSTTAVPYLPDAVAPAFSGYSFPDTSGNASVPHAWFSVFSRNTVDGVPLLPIYRLSKLQDVGGGTDACGFAPPRPEKQYPVLHVYTTSDSEKSQFMSSTAGNCFEFDGIEGYAASYNFTGALETLYRIYNPTLDSYILVPQRHVSTANALGYVADQTPLGMVVAQ